MDLVFDLRGSTYYIDTAIVTPFSSSAGLISVASGRPCCYMAKREEKEKFDRYPRINLVPFVLETTGRPGYHAQKFIKHLYNDTDHPLSRPPCTTASPNNNSEPSPRDSRLLFLTTPHAFFHGPRHPQQFTSRSESRLAGTCPCRGGWPGLRRPSTY